MRSLAAVLGAVVVCSCALRPSYRDVTAHVNPSAGIDAPRPAAPTTQKFKLVDKSSAAPLGGMKIEMSEGKNRYAVTTAADGTFLVPIDEKYRVENPFIVVNGVIPAGGYAIVEAVDAPVVVPAPTPAPAPAPAAEPAPAADPNAPKATPAPAP